VSEIPPGDKFGRVPSDRKKTKCDQAFFKFLKLKSDQKFLLWWAKSVGGTKENAGSYSPFVGVHEQRDKKKSPLVSTQHIERDHFFTN
jgi:hypothetical protein